MPCHTLEADLRGPFTVWEDPDPGRSYCWGADTAGGRMSADGSSCSVVDVHTGDQVAMWSGHVEPSDFAEVVFAIGSMYGGKDGLAYGCPESNNHGLTLVDALRRMGYWRLYTRQTWDGVEKRFISTIGWSTNVKTRPILIGRMRDTLRDADVKIRSRQVLDECDTFVMIQSTSGQSVREDHMSGCHDDALFAHMLALEARHVLVCSGEAGPPPPRKHVGIVAKEQAPHDERSEAHWARQRAIVAERDELLSNHEHDDFDDSDSIDWDIPVQADA